MEPVLIKKEEIVNLHFQSLDVLENQNEKIDREQKLRSAMLLGNNEHQKCKIVFRSKEGDTAIETTIWAVTDKYICLKGGLALLIASIIEVIL